MQDSGRIVKKIYQRVLHKREEENKKRKEKIEKDGAGRSFGEKKNLRSVLSSFRDHRNHAHDTTMVGLDSWKEGGTTHAIGCWKIHRPH